MNGRYIPPSMRQNQDSSHGGTSDIRLSEPSTDLPARSLEQLSSSQPRPPRGRGRGRGYRYGRGYGRGNARPHRPRTELERRPREEGELTTQEIRDHFWLLQYERSEENTTSTQLLPPPQKREQSTLNDSWQYKDELSYLLLFPNANPRWESDSIIFAHTSIDMLPGYAEAFSKAGSETSPTETEEGSTSPSFEQAALEAAVDAISLEDSHDNKPDISSVPQSNEPLISRPLAVFTQTYGERGFRTVYFRFTGWYHLSKVDFLRPRSQELARMMEQKWDIKDSRGRDVQRNKSAWYKSMSMRWAVCQFKKSEDQNEAPAIQIDEKENKQDADGDHQGNQDQGSQDQASQDQGSQDQGSQDQGSQEEPTKHNEVEEQTATPAAV